MRPAFLVFAALLLPGPVRAASCPASPRTAAGVRSTEQAWVSALEHRDSAMLECILDPSFTDTSWRGKLIGRDEVLRSLPSRPDSTLELTDVAVTLIGNVALVRGINTQSRGGTAVGSVRFVDVFVRRGSRWRAVSAQETPIERAR